MRTVNVILRNKKQMKDKKGRQWWGMNPQAAKANSFRKDNDIEIWANAPTSRKRLEKHEYIESKLMQHGDNYKHAHKKALSRERKPLKNIRFKEVKHGKK
jgi:hypothetical protein